MQHQLHNHLSLKIISRCQEIVSAMGFKPGSSVRNCISRRQASDLTAERRHHSLLDLNSLCYFFADLAVHSGRLFFPQTELLAPNTGSSWLTICVEDNAHVMLEQKVHTHIRHDTRFVLWVKSGSVLQNESQRYFTKNTQIVWHIFSWTLLLNTRTLLWHSKQAGMRLA